MFQAGMEVMSIKQKRINQIGEPTNLMILKDTDNFI